MKLTLDDLRAARLENVERLALALGVRLPSPAQRREAYARQLVRLVVRRIERDAAEHTLAARRV